MKYEFFSGIKNSHIPIDVFHQFTEVNGSNSATKIQRKSIFMSKMNYAIIQFYYKKQLHLIWVEFHLEKTQLQ